MKFLKILGVIFLAWPLSCENEQQKFEYLTKKLEKIRQDIESKEILWQIYQQEQQKTWHSTAKERFAFLQNFVKEKWIPIPFSNCIQEVQFQGPMKLQSGYEYIVNVKFQLNKKMEEPSFVIWLYDERGIILGFVKHKNKKIIEMEKQYRIPVDHGKETSYFRIEHE